jgi:hypothetical protein
MNLSVLTTVNDFEWPTILEIQKAQEQTDISPGLEVSEESFRKEGRIWVPNHNLKTRIMIIAHCASSGHRGGETTAHGILRRFWWVNIRKDTQEFVITFLHCTVNAGQVVPRPLAEKMHPSERNQIVHYDFMYMNSVIRELHRLMGSKAHYTFTYSAWSNGTVEVVNNLILNCLRGVISEFKLKLSDWPKLIPLVQGVLNLVRVEGCPE